MTADPRDVAEKLARKHREEDPSTEDIYYSFDAQRGEIQMVEVSGSVGSSGEVTPFRFQKQKDVPYETVLVLLSPDEWESAEAEKLEWPEELQPVTEFERISRSSK
ncbi:MAG: hypothetical protein ABEL76_00400 [Bradymonadaceae bacterium]